MPTNEERKETAKSLYELTKYGAAVPVWHAHLILGLIDDDNYVHGTVLTNDSVVRLADLIEPEPERKAKSKPFPVEKDTGYFDTTLCECGYLNDVSATYCGQCGCVIEVVHYAN